MAEPDPAHRPAASIEDRRADKAKSHRWVSRWPREVTKAFAGVISATSLELVAVLGRSADNDTGESWLFQANIALQMGRTERTVRRATRELERLAIIDYRQGHYRKGSTLPVKSWFRCRPSEEWRTLCPQLADTVSASAPDTLSAPGGQRAREGRSQDPQLADTVSALTAVDTAFPSPQLATTPGRAGAEGRAAADGQPASSNRGQGQQLSLDDLEPEPEPEARGFPRWTPPPGTRKAPWRL